MLARVWNNRTIRQREDGYICLTDMAQACDKRVSNWERLDSTQEYLEALRLRDYSDVSNDVIQVNVGGNSETTGTWGHRKVALRFAQWLSPDFAIQVDEWVEELLLTGKVELQPEPPKLPPTSYERATAVNSLAASIQVFGIEIENPRLKQGLQDLVIDMLGIGQSLPGTSEVWLGVAERAEQLGYPVGLVAKHRSQLGKWTAKHDLTCKREKRLCNGTQREVNVYLQTVELDECIKEYLDVKMLSPVD